MKEKLSEALSLISDAHIAEAAANKKCRPHWIGALAAALALVILITAVAAPTARAEGLLVAPDYPEMAAYPGEDGDYEDWVASRKAQYDQPDGYADSLGTFFTRSIPELLASGGENAVCSPVNIYMALAMLAESTGGDSRQQILDLLGQQDMDALRTQAGHVWNAHYCADGATATVLANSLWLGDGILYNKETIQTLAGDYYASVYQGELGSDQMNAALQSWLNEQTGGLLEEQARNMELTPGTVLALASTVYYRAKWSSGFLESHNTTGIFHAADGDVETTYMNKVMDYGPYYWGESFAATCLRLEDGSKMWLILPDEGKSPTDVLAEGEALEMALHGSENQKSIKVNLSVPKFDAASDSELQPQLQKLGITDVFKPNSADFTPILPESPAWVNSVRHAARVTIDEEGVTAVAYTALQAPGAAPPPEDEVDLVLDRPFLFIITSRDNLPLFAGVVNHP